jgi:hypothetical protein
MKFRANIILNPLMIFALWLLLWAGRLWLIAAYYQRTWERGYYPPKADTIAIPIAGNGVMTIMLAPVFAGALWLLLRRSPVERRTWLAWSRKHWVVSLVWTVPFCLFSLSVLPGFAEDVRIKLPLNAAADVGWFFFWLAVRAVVVSRIPLDGAETGIPDNPLPPTPGGAPVNLRLSAGVAEP